MLSCCTWAGLDVKNIYFCIKMTVDKTHFVNFNLSKMVSVKFSKFGN